MIFFRLYLKRFKEFLFFALLLVYSLFVSLFVLLYLLLIYQWANYIVLQI